MIIDIKNVWNFTVSDACKILLRAHNIATWECCERLNQQHGFTSQVNDFWSVPECSRVDYNVAMIFDCICRRRKAKRSVVKVNVQHLDNIITEYILRKKCTGQECLQKIAKEVNLKEVRATTTCYMNFYWGMYVLLIEFILLCC